jgi:hypothetical protein
MQMTMKCGGKDCPEFGLPRRVNVGLLGHSRAFQQPSVRCRACNELMKIISASDSWPGKMRRHSVD